MAADPFCYAALEALVANHALSAEEERALIDSLAFDPEDEWLRFLYTSMGKKYDEPAIAAGWRCWRKSMVSPAPRMSRAARLPRRTPRRTKRARGENGSPSCPRSFWR